MTSGLIRKQLDVRADVEGVRCNLLWHRQHPIYVKNKLMNDSYAIQSCQEYIKQCHDERLSVTQRVYDLKTTKTRKRNNDGALYSINKGGNNDTARDF